MMLKEDLPDGKSLKSSKPDGLPTACGSGADARMHINTETDFKEVLLWPSDYQE